jgi:hypothetical protein
MARAEIVREDNRQAIREDLEQALVKARTQVLPYVQRSWRAKGQPLWLPPLLIGQTQGSAPMFLVIKKR